MTFTNNKKIYFVFLLIAVLVGIVFFWNNIADFYAKFLLKLPEIEKNINAQMFQEIQKKVSEPPPLKSDEEAAQSFLTRAGVIKFTNIEREKAGLPRLKENLKLDSSADKKANDMLVKQYFAHESPSGVGVADLAKEANYDYIEIGENLALGNFKDDQTLVEAWMNSPGHRANILNSQYQEIGVAVIRGKFEGKNTWFAVQHFGFPLSSCQQPSQTLKAKINLNQTQIQQIQANLDFLKNEIENMPLKPRELYNEKIDEYNNLVSQYNSLAIETKSLIKQYNNEIQIFNDCASGVK
jgi:uncharacterized protein YkwD